MTPPVTHWCSPLSAPRWTWIAVCCWSAKRWTVPSRCSPPKMSDTLRRFFCVAAAGVGGVASDCPRAPPPHTHTHTLPLLFSQSLSLSLSLFVFISSKPGFFFFFLQQYIYPVHSQSAQYIVKTTHPLLCLALAMQSPGRSLFARWPALQSRA
jgi:hypothetical protein